MRVTDAMHLQNWMKNLQSTSEKLSRAEQAVASQKILRKPSDDPAGMSRVIRLNDQINKLDRYIEAVDDGLGWLKTMEGTLASLTGTISEAKETALMGANGTVTDGQRQDMAKQVGLIIDYVVSLGNTQYADRYIFAGEKTDTKPFIMDKITPDTIIYDGGTGTVNRQVMLADKISVNYSGQETFIDSNVFGALFHLKGSLEANNIDQIKEAAEELDKSLTEVVSQRGLMGVKMNRFAEIKEQHNIQKSHFKGIVGELEEGNLAELITNMKREQTAYEAALAVGARINSVSLLDYIR